MKAIALIASLAIASQMIACSRGSNGKTNAATNPTAAAGPKPSKSAEPKLSEIDAAVCKIDITNKTFAVMLWSGDTWKKGQPIILSWEDGTEVHDAFGTDHTTMAGLVGGGSFMDLHGATDLNGERAYFYLAKIGDKDVVRKMGIGIARFAHEVSFAVPTSGSLADEINEAAKPNKVKCHSGK